MGQEEVIDFLKTCTEPKTRRQIAEALSCEPVKISHIIQDLIKWEEIRFIEHNRFKASELVGYLLLRRTRFYFVEEIKNEEEM